METPKKTTTRTKTTTLTGLFLTVVGVVAIASVAFGLWCAIDPLSTRQEVNQPQIRGATIVVDQENGPHYNIQSGINVAVDGDTVLVKDGTYTGDGNRDIDFHGKAITVTSENGPNVTIIDCAGTAEDQHRGFYFHNNETQDSVLDGFTIQNGHAKAGGAIYGNLAGPTISDCIIQNNVANNHGGGDSIHRGR